MNEAIICRIDHVNEDVSNTAMYTTSLAVNSVDYIYFRFAK